MPEEMGALEALGAQNAWEITIGVRNGGARAARGSQLANVGVSAGSTANMATCVGVLEYA